MSGDRICDDCGAANPVWFAPSPLWNEVVGSPNGILCPNCFIQQAEAKGHNQTAWAVAPHG